MLAGSAAGQQPGQAQPGVPTELQLGLPQLPTTATPASAIDLRSFAEQKKPETVNQRVAVMAYYLAHVAQGNDRRDFITAADIKKYFIQAGFPLPSSPPRITLANVKNAGYLDSRKEGQYVLNPIGHNLVAHKLPALEEQDVERRPKRRAKRRTRR
jgi:hypothetical protein